MEIDEKLTPEFAAVDDVVRAHAPEFELRGFTLASVAPDMGSPLIRSLVFHFTNTQARLRLDLSFFSAGRRRGFNALLIRPDNRKLDVRDYLVLHDRQETAQRMTDEHGADLRAFADATIRMLLELFDRELKPIIEGRTWEETPIDWQGYR